MSYYVVCSNTLEVGILVGCFECIGYAGRIFPLAFISKNLFV